MDDFSGVREALMKVTVGYVASFKAKQQGPTAVFWALWATRPEDRPWPRPVVWGRARNNAEAQRHASLFLPDDASLVDVKATLARAWFRIKYRLESAAHSKARVLYPTPERDMPKTEGWGFDQWSAYFDECRKKSEPIYRQRSAYVRVQQDKAEAQWLHPERPWQITSDTRSGSNVGNQAALLRLGLDLSRRLTVDEVRTAFREMARKHHPDAGGKAEDFRACHAAYEAIMEELSA